MGRLLLVTFLVVPVAELYVLIQVGHALGAVTTVALLFAETVLGAAVVRRQGRRTWAGFRAAAAAGQVPTRQVADGALTLLGGVLLMLPGFLTDALGMLCLLPPTRALLRRGLTRYLARRLPLVGLLTVPGRDTPLGHLGVGRRRGPGWSQDSKVVDGQVVKDQVTNGRPNPTNDPPQP